VPDEPVLHLLQQQDGFGRREIGGVEGVDQLVLNALDNVERGRAAAALRTRQATLGQRPP
jgi:hypothetical protein